MMAGANMTGTGFLSVKRTAPQIQSGILRRVKQTADLLFLSIQKPQVFATINHLISHPEIFRGKSFAGITRDIARRFHQLPEALCARPQTLSQSLAGAVHVIVKAAAGPAGLTCVRLTQND